MSENPQSFFNCVLGGYRNLIIITKIFEFNKRRR